MADEPASQRLNQLIPALVERYQRDWAQIATELADDHNAADAFKPLALWQVLGNLIDNARRYGWPPIVIATCNRPTRYTCG